MPGVFELLKKGWDIYAKNWRTYLPYLIALFIATLATELLNNKYGPTQGTFIARNWNELASFGLIILPLFLVVFYIGLALLMHLYHITKNQPTSVPESFRSVGRRFLPTLGAYILSSLLLAIGGVIMYFQSLKGAPGLPDKTSLIIMGVAFLVLVIPGIIFAVWFMFSYFEALFDGKNPIAAMKASYALVHGRFWHVTWLAVATGIIISMITYLITDISKWIIVRGIMGSLTESVPAGNLAVIVITTLFGTLIIPWGYGITLNLYAALKEPKESSDHAA